MFYVLVNVEEWLADMGDINAELQRSSSTCSLPTDGMTTSAMTSDYDSEDYGDGASDSPVPPDQPHSSSQDEEERPDSAEIDKDWGRYLLLNKSISLLLWLEYSFIFDFIKL